MIQRIYTKWNRMIISLYDAVAEHCVQVATHRHGCCVMQRCIDHGTQAQEVNNIILFSSTLFVI